MSKKQDNTPLPPRVVVQTKVVYVTPPRAMTRTEPEPVFRGTTNGDLEDHRQKVIRAFRVVNGRMRVVDEFCEPYRTDGLTAD